MYLFGAHKKYSGGRSAGSSNLIHSFVSAVLNRLPLNYLYHIFIPPPHPKTLKLFMRNFRNRIKLNL